MKIYWHGTAIGLSQKYLGMEIDRRKKTPKYAIKFLIKP